LISASELQMKYRRIFIWKNKTKKKTLRQCVPPKYKRETKKKY